MKILIIEDKDIHLATAKLFAEQSGHNITIVKTYDEAETALCGTDRINNKDYPTVYDVILTDLLLPVSTNGQSNHDIQGEMPYGIILVLLAMRKGIKKIALLTDGNHHHHPFIWAIDPLGGYIGHPYMLGDTKILFSSAGFIYQKYRGRTTPLTVPDGDSRIGGKAWDVLLATLMAE